MLKRDVLRFFGGAVVTAERLTEAGFPITHQAVYKWPEELPRSAERKVRGTLRKFLERAGAAR
jgi:hypothetical protein